MNAHDAVVDAVLAALRASPAVTTGLIEEDIDAELLPEGTTQAVIVNLATSDPREQYLSRIDWTSLVAIQCLAAGDGRTAGARASRDLHRRVYDRLMQDRTLGGAVMDVGEPRIQQTSAQADRRLGTCAGVYPIKHRTVSGSLQP